MPATFAHCLMAQKSIDVIQKKLKESKSEEYLLEYAGIIGEKNNFVLAGAAGPDYPYCTDMITSVKFPFRHNWANRMHYENTLLFVREAIRKLASFDTRTEQFSICLAWFCGFVSHVVADSYAHPIVNSIVGGTYMFTGEEHAHCELIQDEYIFKAVTGEDVPSSNPNNGKLGYLTILEECSDPTDKDLIHPEIRVFWTGLLKTSHPNAVEHFETIDPDEWHRNYKKNVNFIVNPGAVFRHAVALTGRDYKKESDITPTDRVKYITNIKLPNGQISNYEKVFDDAMNLVVDVWLKIFQNVNQGNCETVGEYIKDWNLDTGVNEQDIYFWSKMRES